ncbi:hypothetical protein SUGI_0630270 [Cryptomeria japonica]|nr:hypothetical protein SUGI_0630270 [Cryptomeria japonica]
MDGKTALNRNSLHIFKQLRVTFKMMRDEDAIASLHPMERKADMITSLSIPGMRLSWGNDSNSGFFTKLDGL